MKTTTEKSSYDTQAETFLASNSIKFRAVLSDSKTPAWKTGGEKSGHHFRVTLSKAGHGRCFDNQAKRITFDFWSSVADANAGIKTVPPCSVLACISGDANCPDKFEDFCGEYGYEADSIKALQTFRRCSSFAKRLQSFFTAAELKQLAQIQ